MSNGLEDFSLFDLFRKMGGIHPARAPGVYAAEVPPLKLKVRADHPEVLRPDFFSRLRCPEFVGARQ